MKSKNFKKPDKILLFTILALLIIGALALFSASLDESQKDFNNVYGYFVHQLLFGFLAGGILAVIAYKLPYGRIKQMALPMFLASLFLMILVFVPAFAYGSEAVQRWINLGFVTFQPSEFIKFTFIIFLASWLQSHDKEMKKISSVIPFIAFLGILGVLFVAQPDISTLGIIIITAGAMYFTAGARLKHLALVGSLGLGALYFLIKLSPYRLDRIITYLNPSQDPLGISYQINQALITLGSGKMWGAGILGDVQRYKFLPEPMNDSIFAVWAEGAGFIGATILVLLFIIFMWRGFKIATNANNKFVKYTAVGITVWIFSQAFVNMAATVGLLPLTGIPLPFISYGGSAMITTLAASGLLLQLSKHR